MSMQLKNVSVIFLHTFHFVCCLKSSQRKFLDVMFFTEHSCQVSQLVVYWFYMIWTGLCWCLQFQYQKLTPNWIRFQDKEEDEEEDGPCPISCWLCWAVSISSQVHWANVIILWWRMVRRRCPARNEASWAMQWIQVNLREAQSPAQSPFAAPLPSAHLHLTLHLHCSSCTTAPAPACLHLHGLTSALHHLCTPLHLLCTHSTHAQSPLFAESLHLLSTSTAPLHLHTLIIKLFARYGFKFHPLLLLYSTLNLSIVLFLLCSVLLYLLLALITRMILTMDVHPGRLLWLLFLWSWCDCWLMSISGCCRLGTIIE